MATTNRRKTQLASFPSRRTLLSGMAASAALWPLRKARSNEAVTFGLTPVFLDSDVRLLADLKAYMTDRIGCPVSLVKRRTYQDITLMLLSGQLDAAWICGFPYVQYRNDLSLVAVPIYNGQPLYQSYVIVNQNVAAESFDELRGRSHAFSDPDSNSGFLVTRALLADMSERPETFFNRHFYTYGHRNVIRAVASGLAQSGSVDGYVWDVMLRTEPDIVQGARIIRRSEWLGFPPVACTRAARENDATKAIADALIHMPADPLGQEVLKTLHLDGFEPASDNVFHRIASLYAKVRNQA